MESLGYSAGYQDGYDDGFKDACNLYKRKGNKDNQDTLSDVQEEPTIDSNLST